jgi:HD domain
MQKNDLDFFKKWFLEYVNQFSASDCFTQDNVKRKIEHTGRVCENILLLAKSEKIGEEGHRLAETIALFHDLGRFEQFMRYKTFLDSESENHALLGVKILKRMGILSQLPSEEKYLILKAVEYHNRLKIPECSKSPKELLFYSKLIRDADKLDILRIMSESYKEGERGCNPAFEHYLPDTAGYSETIIQDILNKRMAKIRDVRNVNDLKLLRLSLIYDLNFPTSFAILKERKYLSTVISSMAESEEVNIIRKFIEDYLGEAEIAFPNTINKP